MPGSRDSTIVKLEFSSGASVSPSQAFAVLKNNGVEVKEIEMLQPLAARNTYDLKFRSDAARIQGVSRLKGLEGLTVTPYDRSVVVTVLYLNFEVDQGLVARVLSQYGTVSDMRWVTYRKREIPSFLFIGGSKAHIRYFGQPRTCFKCSEEGHEAKSCPNRRCGKCLQVGHEKAECPNEVRCNLCGGEGHVSGSCPTSYSARASADVGPAHEPSQSGPEPMVEEPRSPSPDEVAHQVEQDFLAAKQCEGVSGTPGAGPPSSSSSTPGEAGLLTVENDLQLSSDSETDSAMSDAGGPASEPPPKEPPSGEGWFDLCKGVETESKLKRSASAGDFNCVPDTQFDRMSTHTSSSCGVGIAELDMFTKNHDMVDVWRVQHPAWPCSLGTALMARTPQGWTGCTLHLLCHRGEERGEQSERNGDPSALHAIQQFLDEKLHGARVRARVHCVEAEEKPTIKFYRDVTKYAIDRRIKRVRDVHGVVQKDPLDIVEVFKSFYEQLYTQADVDEGLQKTLLDNIDKTPSRDQNDELGSPLTVDELWKAVAKMKGGKAPGSDGIPMEFYKRFWGTVGHDLRDVFVSAFLAGSLSPSQRTGVITLLPKSGDPLEPKNKRPITLLRHESHQKKKLNRRKIKEKKPPKKTRKLFFNKKTPKRCPHIRIQKAINRLSNFLKVKLVYYRGLTKTGVVVNSPCAHYVPYSKMSMMYNKLAYMFGGLPSTHKFF
ncbi:hypothetical protein HOLleu_02278 [Holothuria leucospilota]|uniref:CCHC-type domain-containing protein n=1 Tax=Holothuria leucospilota TaxID=206669 RepID=A0A9Q1CR26_HOLLE|nr:hypothetical protein HOLleu_02278 [Holothuria leucospilota]